jgi:hypothetical protein
VKLTLKDAQTINALSELLYDYLPGSGSPTWKGHISFKTIAFDLGLGGYFQSGSKLPMIQKLLTDTLENRPERFESLILEIVKGSLVYRKKQGSPLKKSDIDTLNGLLLQLQFKFPYLRDPVFLEQLEQDPFVRAQQQIINEQAKIYPAEKIKRKQRLRDTFFELCKLEDRQKAGILLQDLLNELFEISDLKPRRPFRVVGEEIDGSFIMDYETYLVEAKWEKKPINESRLLVLRGKIEGKSNASRGVYISINGYSDEARKAIVTGKQPNFFAIDGIDLLNMLSEEVELIDFLRTRQRLLAEEGSVFVPFSDLENAI